MGGGEGTRPCLLHFFYLGTIPDKSLLFVQFFTVSIPDCFLSYMFAVLAEAELIGVSPREHKNLRYREGLPSKSGTAEPKGDSLHYHVLLSLRTLKTIRCAKKEKSTVFIGNTVLAPTLPSWYRR